MTYNLNRDPGVDGGIIEAPMPQALELPKTKGEVPYGYFRIPLGILQVDTIPWFSIYLRVQGKREYALYKSRGSKFKEEHKDKLSANRINEIFIKSSERRLYSKYIEDNLKEIIADDSFAIEKKSRLLYNSSTELLREIFNRTQIADKIPKVARLVRHIVDHACQGIEEFISMLDVMSHDYYTVNHSVNVCILGVALGNGIGLDRDELYELGIGLILHDLGKSKIDESILMKKGPLNDSEWKIIKNHPTYGAEIAESTKQVTPLSLTVIRQHHEKCSGKGYPLGLYEPQIHLFSRIAALADVYDALTTERPYSSARNAFSAIQLMQKEMANDFSRDLFKELVLLLTNKPE